MDDVNDIELTEIIADALHRSGPALNPERVDMMHARLRANFIVRTLRAEGVACVRHDAAPATAERPRRQRES